MKILYKKEKGVSPVIATILMVAITVVLASAVYLMVSGYIGTGPKGPTAMSFTYTVNPNNDVITVASGSISISTAQPMTITITYNGNTGSATLTSLNIGDTNNITNALTTSNSNLKGINVIIYAFHANIFEAGDTITLFTSTGGTNQPVPPGTSITIVYNGNTILSHTF
jgi:flagellin-like protein